MAILDKKLEFADALACTTSASASLATSNVINLGTGYNEWGDTAYNNIGEGGDIWFNVRVATTITPALCVFTLYLVTASAAATCLLGTTTGGTAGTRIYEQTITGQAHTAGTTLVRVKVPAKAFQQYCALYLNNSATAITAGALDAWLSLDSESEMPTS